MLKGIKKKLSVHALFHHNPYHIKLKTKLLISYVLLILVPFGFYTAFTFSSISESSRQQLQQAADQVLEQTRGLLNYKLNNVIYASDQLFYDEEMNKTIKRDQNLALGPQLLEDLNKMKVMISNAFKAEDMHRLILYLDSSVYYSNSYSISGDFKTHFSNISSISGEDWYQKLHGHDGKVMWVKPTLITRFNDFSETVIPCVRFIKDIDNYSNIIGVLRFDLLQSDINTIVEKAATTDNGVAYLLNSDGDIMASSDMNLAGEYNAGMNLSALPSGSRENWHTATVNDAEVVIGALPIKNTDWVLVSIIPSLDIQAAGWQITRKMLPFLVLAVTLSSLMAIVFSYTITKRVHILSKKMMGIRNETLPGPMEEKGSDEISMLIRSYNYMIGKIKQFSETQYKLGRDVKNAELKALQAQIDPHFLYNTLDLVNWVALRNKVPEISEIVLKLTKYYRLSLSKGKDVISIRDEMVRIETYVNLQNLRFRNRLTLVIDIDENLYRYSILKLILQPIVENSIIHGIFEKDTKTGTITITGKLKGEILILSVRDDGVGIEGEKAGKLFCGGNPTEEQGYGVINVNHRIKLYYGSDYGLTCKSSVGAGTTVDITIPAMPMD